MYLHPLHRFASEEAAVALMRAHPLGAWVCHGPEGLLANHLPFWLDTQRGPHGTLVGHVARANPVWRALGQGAGSVVMFQAAQHYITPTWYPGHAAHGQVVPTWNYAAVHAHGVARAVHSREWLLGMLQRLTEASEAGQACPWRMGDAPPDFMEQMLRGIVGIEIPIDRLEARLKASQDEALEDRLGTVAGLLAMGGEQARSMAGWVQHALQAAAPGDSRRYTLPEP